MKFSMYENQFDVYPVTNEGEWEDIVQVFVQGQFPETTNKTQFPHISLSTFDGYKNGEHGLEMSGLILDYDDSMSVEEASELFREYEFLFYTSYNHQRRKKNKDGTTSEPVDKFRLIFPFTETCPYDEWLLRMEYVIKFAPRCDPASKKFVQCYCLPATHPDNLDNTIMFRNSGRVLDWHSFPVTKKDEHHATGTVAKYTSGNQLKPDDVIQLKKGTIVARDVDRRYQCYCPFHDDKSPGAFISKSDKGNIYLYCNKCGTAYLEKEEESASDFLKRMREKNVKKENNFKKKCATIESVEELFDIDEQKVCAPYSREKRTQLLARKFKKSQKQYIALYAFEGYGKSSLAVEESKKGTKVVFGCESNQQAREQAKSFEDRGCRVQCIVSRDYQLINDYDVEVEYGEQPNPWASRPVKDAATKKNIAIKFNKAKEEVEEFYDLLKPEAADFTKYDIVVTTHDRISGWGRIHMIQEGKAKKEGILIPVFDGKSGPIVNYKDLSPEGESATIIPKDAIIFFDDPSYDDFSLLYDFDNKWADKKIDGQLIEVREIDNRKYFVRPPKYLFGYGFRNKIIFSTTELITLELINAGYGRHKVDVPSLMPNDKMDAGRITVIKTERVRKRWDGLLPPIVERLKKDGFEFEYFADGQGNDYNLVTSKGQNIFDDKDTLIEISQPHESKVIKLQHELQWEESDRFAVRVAICLDQMHQAIGRNCGYRWSDKEEYDDRREAVVLVEPLICDELCDKSRYYIRKQMDLGSEAVRRPETKNFVSSVTWYVGNIRAYLVNNRSFEYDVVAALKSVSIIKKMARHKRMSDSIKNAINVFGNLPNLVRASAWLEKNHR